MKLTNKIILVLLDGEQHDINELIAICQSDVTPEECVRNYIRKNNYREINDVSFEEQVRKGLHMGVMETLYTLESKGDVSQDFLNGHRVQITQNGFDKSVTFTKGGRCGKVFKQLRLMLETGNFYINLTRRNNDE